MRRRNIRFILASLILIVLLPFSLFSQEVPIQVSPNILNLHSSGVVVSIHADIQFSTVAAATVLLNGIAIRSWKSDNQGYFVAKFDMLEVKESAGLELGENNTFTLTGETVYGGTFSGSTEILVINNIPSGKN